MKEFNNTDQTKLVEIISELNHANQKQPSGGPSLLEEVHKVLIRPESTVTFLDTAHQYAFLNHNTGEKNSKDIQNMPADGFTVDCSEKVPAQANGVIIAVLIVGVGKHTNTYFVCSDANGSFYESANNQAVNGIYNYSGAWMSGILFCPFLKSTKQFKYLVGQFDERETHCRATLVGWF